MDSRAALHLGCVCGWRGTGGALQRRQEGGAAGCGLAGGVCADLGEGEDGGTGSAGV